MNEVCSIDFLFVGTALLEYCAESRADWQLILAADNLKSNFCLLWLIR